jgi:hypothetical protein
MLYNMYDRQYKIKNTDASALGKGNNQHKESIPTSIRKG